ncbi:3-ketosteroid-delta-1-dehydrogenase [Gordonia sp. NPDC127522]|uniref:3-ketosteroid-delta-1-dehydrogenase n=1 Tax=Gordonia sp. NPDC127522 TaxID=3345390 RepID=UPI0036452AAF
MSKSPVPPTTRARNITVDLLVVGCGTGMAAALAADELGLSTLIVEKSEFVGGSTALSGGAFWIPGSSIFPAESRSDDLRRARTYLRNVVRDTAPPERAAAYLDNGPRAVDMLMRRTPLKFAWTKGYSDYHANVDGGTEAGRTCESRPFDLSVLGTERARLRGGIMEASVPMPITSADFKWMNLMAKKPLKALPRIIRRMTQGLGGKAIGREYAAGGQAIAGGLFAGVLAAGIPIWTETPLVRLLSETDDETGTSRVVGAVVSQHGEEYEISTRRGVVLTAGGFEHDMETRRKYQSEQLLDHASFGAESNTGDAIRIGQEVGAAVGSMDEAWWFPAFAAPPGGRPLVMLAERALPGSIIIDQRGKRFVNEAIDYMSYGQLILDREQTDDEITDAWLVFDQQYRNSYMLAGFLFPRQPLPTEWIESEMAVKAHSVAELADSIGVPVAAFDDTLNRFNAGAAIGVDSDFGRGDSPYDRYYGDPTIKPNPNLRALDTETLYAVRIVLSDLGTCGGLIADERARVISESGSPIPGLYAAGNCAANAFGHVYPGAGATIGQGIVYGYIAANEAASTS